MAALIPPKLTALDLDLQSGWLTVWFNEPERRNALTAPRVKDILTLCEWLQPNRCVRGVTFRGRGGMFCAGGDLKGMKTAISGADAKRKITEISCDGAQLFESVNGLPQVVIMAVEGAVMAGGLGLACTGDIIISGKDVKFAFTETRLGIPPAQITPFVLARLGNRIGRRLLLTGEVVSGADALTLGLVDQIVEDPAQMDDAIKQIQKSVLKAAPQAVAVTKSLVQTLPGLSRSTQIETAGEAFANCLLSEEGKEGISSFLEKRKPNWVLGSK